jgi:hypothetical protein
MQRRQLSEMLVDVTQGVLAARSPGVGVHAESIELELPVEIRLIQRVGGMPAFAGDLPVWRWRTEFDQKPNRLSVTWTKVDLSITGIEGKAS